MLAYAIALILAVLVVPLTSGSFTRLAVIRFRRPGLFVAGVGIQIALEFVEIPRSQFETVGLALLLTSYVALLGFAASNLHTRGFALILVGITANTLVIALNAGMPYRVDDGIERETTVKHRPSRDTDLLVALSDEITLGPPIAAAISVGDLILAAGIIELAYFGSRRPRRTGRPVTGHPESTLDLAALERDEIIDLRDPDRRDPVGPSVSTSRRRNRR